MNKSALLFAASLSACTVDSTPELVPVEVIQPVQYKSGSVEELQNLWILKIKRMRHWSKRIEMCLLKNI